MTKPDDSTLTLEDLRIIEERAKCLLDSASAWDRFPTPIDDIMAAAKVRLSPVSVFDAAAIIAYIKGKATDVATTIKSAVSKIFGICDNFESLIHIDPTVAKSKQNFLKLHETAHHNIPTHRKTFRLFEDCEKTLDPYIADQFEREANNFARFALFQGNTYSSLAADCALTIKTPMDLAKKFGASLYASAREFARTNHRACVVYILEPIEYVEGAGARALVRRIEPSPSFIVQFGIPADTVINIDHHLGSVLPIGRKMNRSVSIAITDLNGIEHDCIAESFDTTHNVLVLLCPVQALTSTSLILPPGFKTFAA